MGCRSSALATGRTDRALAAILAGDGAGYSRLIGADEGGTLQAFKTLRSDLFEPTVATHNGLVRQDDGSGCLSRFGHVVERPDARRPKCKRVWGEGNP